MSKEKQRTGDELFGLAAKGDAQALWELALLGYWEYVDVIGNPSKTEAMRYIDAAGANGDANLEKKVGDFFRFEFQDDRAELHYFSAHGKMLRLAMSGDVDAQFECAMQFAYGQGCEQDDRNACFWCLMAAQNGHKEAQFMMGNFWKNGTVLPVCAEMADFWTRTAEKSNPMPQMSKELSDINKAVCQAQYTNDEIAVVSKQLQMKKPIRYKVWNSSRNPILAVTNFLSDRLGAYMFIGFCLYTLASILSYIIVSFMGYKEAGFGHFLNRVFAFCLHTPFEILARSSMTLEELCEWVGHSEGNIIIDLIVVCIEALVPLIWLAVVAVCSFIAYCLLDKLLVRKGLFVKEMPYSGADESAAKKQLSCLEEQRTAHMQVLEGIYQQHRVPEKLQNTFDMMGICNIALSTQCDFGTAMAKYSKLVETAAPDMQHTDLRASDHSYSRMALYFILPRIGMTDENGDRVMLKYRKAPAQNFDVRGQFMRGYIDYRRGYNFNIAGKAFEEAAKPLCQNTQAEKGYAAWYLAALNRSEFMPTGYNPEKKSECNKAIELYDKLAAENYQCPLAVVTPEVIGSQAWRLDANMLDKLSKLYEKADKTFSAYLHDMALQSLTLQQECGNPFNMAEWNGRKTKCIWAQYNKMSAKVDEACEIMRDIPLDENNEAAYYAREKKVYAPLNKECNSLHLRNRGLTRADELCEGIKSTVDTADYVANREINKIREQRKQEQVVREREINRKMSEWNEQADAFERSLNANLFNSYATDFERSLAGEMSQQDYVTSDFLRYEAEKSYRKKLESEYDQ